MLYKALQIGSQNIESVSVNFELIDYHIKSVGDKSKITREQQAKAMQLLEQHSRMLEDSLKRIVFLTLRRG